MKRAMSLTHARIVGNMWAVCVVVAVTSLSGPAAFALDPMGPPRAMMDKGQFSLALDVLLSKADLEVTDGTWTNSTQIPPTGVLTDRTIKDFETTKLYATAGYGFALNWEGFLGVAATKAEFGDDLWNSGESFDSGAGLGVRGGLRATIIEFPEYDLQVGGLIQLNWANYDGELNVPTQVGSDFVDIDLVETQIAVGATYWWLDGFIVYAGPFVHYINGDLEEVDVTGFDIEWDVDDGPTWGAYIGAQVDLDTNWVLNVEYQFSSDASLLGAGLMFTY